MRTPKPKDVDSYIANSDAAARPILEELRAIVTSAVPGVDETISWGVPFYRYHGALAGYAAYKNHVSFGCGGADLQGQDREALERRGFETGKNTVRIRFDQTVPSSVIRRMLEAQAKANEAHGVA